VSSAELAVVAALGSSALTAVATLGVTWFREWLRGRAAGRDALGTAITEMLSRSMAVMMAAQTLGLTMKSRSGLGEGLDVATRLRKPSDPMELHDWIAKDMGPLNEAWSAIWVRGDQETIRLANALLGACAEIVSAGTQRQPADTAPARLRRWAVGERQTPDMEADLQAAIKAVAHAREQLARHSRRKLGLPAAELFTPRPSCCRSYVPARGAGERPSGHGASRASTRSRILMRRLAVSTASAASDTSS
jgi:hypothetical protein